jgi:RNA polymerase sigma factor (sigma-70 family)
LIKNGDESKALSLIYKKVFPKIKQLIKKMSGTADDAKDIFQDAVITFYKKAITNELKENTDVAGYIYILSRNAWLTKTKRESRKYSIESLEIDTVAEDNHVGALIDKEREQQIRTIFSSLGKRCEDLLLYKFFYDYSMKDIAEKMGFKNEDSVKTQHYKCKQHLIDIAEKNPMFRQLLEDAKA